jgi:DNA polymerase-3 subunit gamma/tau
MYQVIARKFRPRRFEDVVGQEHVTRVIGNAIDLGRLPHAFIFSGPRGVGKTSVARILARAINCERGMSSTPCNECPICQDITASRAVDVFEIDAATHTQVDKIRDLIDNARYAPAVARYKTFIIDEVHMLSRSAFNALLKTLEEPPPHVVFILATTELAKVPLTVLSRCQRYDFRRIPVEGIVSTLRTVAAREGITVTDDALLTIALQADGSMRDAQGTLEHIWSAASGPIDSDSVASALGLVGRPVMRDLVGALVKKDAPVVLDVVERVHGCGQDLGQLYRSLVEHFRNMMVLKAGFSSPGLPQEDAAFLREIMEPVPLEEIHRDLSVLVRSEDDLRFTSFTRTTLETILMRIVAAPRLLDIQELIQAVSSRAGVLPYAHERPPDRAEVYRNPPSSLPVSWEGFVAFLREHDLPLHAVVANARTETSGPDGFCMVYTGSFLADQARKALPDIQKRARAFFRKDVTLAVRAEEAPAGGNARPRPSEVRASVLQSNVVREIVSEFNGTVRHVKPKEQE